MVLVMKFSSSSAEAKQALEATLGVYVGTVSADTDFAVKLGESQLAFWLRLAHYT